MQAVILAGGEGTRMGRTSARVPKPLLYLPGGTLLEHQLALLAQLPVRQVFVVIRHHGTMLRRALAGAEDVAALTQTPPFTLLGALASVERYVTESLMVLHGDNLFSRGLGCLARAADSAENGTSSEAFFTVESGGNAKDQAERLACTGCYILPTATLPVVRQLAQHDELRPLTRALVESGMGVREVPLRGWRANINGLSDLLTASQRLLEDWSGSFHPAKAGQGYNRTQTSWHRQLPIWVSPEAEVVDSHLGPLAVIGPRAIVRNCVLRNVIVFPHAQIEDLKLEDGIVLPDASGSVILAP